MYHKTTQQHRWLSPAVTGRMQFILHHWATEDRRYKVCFSSQRVTYLHTTQCCFLLVGRRTLPVQPFSWFDLMFFLLCFALIWILRRRCWKISEEETRRAQSLCPWLCFDSLIIITKIWCLWWRWLGDQIETLSNGIESKVESDWTAGRFEEDKKEEMLSKFPWQHNDTQCTFNWPHFGPRASFWPAELLPLRLWTMKCPYKQWISQRVCINTIETVGPSERLRTSFGCKYFSVLLFCLKSTSKIILSKKFPFQNLPCNF